MHVKRGKIMSMPKTLKAEVTKELNSNLKYRNLSNVINRALVEESVKNIKEK